MRFIFIGLLNIDTKAIIRLKVDAKNEITLAVQTYCQKEVNIELPSVCAICICIGIHVSTQPVSMCEQYCARAPLISF